MLIAHPHVRLDMETWKCDHQVLLQYFLPKIHFASFLHIIDLSHVPLEEEKEWLPPWKMS